MVGRPVPLNGAAVMSIEGMPAVSWVCRGDGGGLTSWRRIGGVDRPFSIEQDRGDVFKWNSVASQVG